MTEPLPRLMTEKQVAEALGVKPSTVRSLRAAGKIAYTMIGAARYMYPREAVDDFVDQNTVMPCPDQTEAPTWYSSKSGTSTISDGRKPGAVENAQRVRAIGRKLRKFSQNSLSDGANPPAPLTRANTR